MGLFTDLMSSFGKGKKDIPEEDLYGYTPDDNMSEQDQLSLQKLIKERAKKGKKRMVEVE